jgi:hypothetical protein
MPSLETPATMLRLSGASNAYVVDPAFTDPMLRLATAAGQSEVVRMNQFVNSAPSWASETKPRWSVAWAARELPSIPPSQRLPVDYRQDEASPAGCDEKSLPTVLEPKVGENDVSSLRSALRNVGIYGER